MEILGFLFGLGCLVVIAWAIALLGYAVFVASINDKSDFLSNH